MRLRTLHAENVLSFSSLDLEFPPGLTVIVGPNGAGKSNVFRLVALVRAALDAIVGASGPGDIHRYLRIGAEGVRGKVVLGIELTEPRERSLLLGFVRALMAASMDRHSEHSPVESPSADSPFEQALAVRVREAVGDADVESLCRGRLVLWLDPDPPARFALAYEFDHDGTTYHCGLAGGGVPSGVVAVGPFSPQRLSSWSTLSLDLQPFLTGETPPAFTFTDLLPDSVQMVGWGINPHPSAPAHHLPLSIELARSLALSNPQAGLSFGQVLYHAMRDGLVLTDNLRRPPRIVYDVAEVGPTVVLDDAGSLPLELYRRKVGPSPQDRAAFQAVQCLFTELTGLEFDLAVSIDSVPSDEPLRFIPQLVTQSTGFDRSLAVTFQPVSGPPGHQLRIQPVVLVGAGQIPVEFAGAGVWEALVVSTVAARLPGRVVLLDEPAINVHPTWQRQVLGHLRALNQVILTAPSQDIGGHILAGMVADHGAGNRLTRPVP